MLPSEDGHARIRIFTPTNEMLFAGHPTLGSAFVLAGPLQLEEIRLETGKGVIPVRLEREGARIVFGRMEQPLPTIEPYAEADTLLEALGVERSELPVEAYDNGMGHVYVTLGSEDGGRCAEARPVAPHRPAALARRQHDRRQGVALEDADVRARRRRARGSGDGLRGRAAGSPPRPPRPHRATETRSRSRRAPRSAARRRSTPASTARRTSSSGWRSAGPRWSSREASSGSVKGP